MSILIACDKFKGSLTATEVCQAIKEGLLAGLEKQGSRGSLGINMLPIADGGDGSLEVMQTAIGGKLIEANTIDPLGRPIQASYLLQDGKAYVEMAKASGIALLEEGEKRVIQTHTEGTGRLIVDALNRGSRDITLFAGGSATNDAGLGIARALGYRFYGENGEEIMPVGGNLSNIIKIEKEIDLPEFSLTILTDVTNPFYGKKGAAFVYAPQKGADEHEVYILDKGLRHVANLIRWQFGRDIDHLEGAGAAGGLAGGLVGILGAKIRNGFEAIKEITGLQEKIMEAQLVITGEGKLDHQSLDGKVVGGIMQICRSMNKYAPIVFTGKSELQAQDYFINQVYEIMSLASSTEDAIQHAASYLHELAFLFGKSHYSKYV
ncbi:MAG: glycerate kinase [Bacteroidota bacterium]